MVGLGCTTLQCLTNAVSVQQKFQFIISWYRNSVNFFVPYATQFGFFINVPRFLASILPSDPRLHRVRPSPALLSAVHLFGIHLSGSQALTSHESVFLTRAVHNVLSFHAPHQVIHSIQAEVLLSHYFLRNGRFLEAMHRINSAVSLSIGCGLHKQRSPTTNSDVAFELAPPRDAIEQGERIDGFWTILILHKCWGVSLQWPSTISDVLDEQINIPWPLEMFAYESVSHFTYHQVPFDSHLHPYLGTNPHPPSATLDLENVSWWSDSYECWSCQLYSCTTRQSSNAVRACQLSRRAMEVRYGKSYPTTDDINVYQT